MAAVSSLQTIFHLQPSGLKPQRPTHVLMPACLPDCFFFLIINVPLYKLAKVTVMSPRAFDLKPYKINPIAKFYGSLSTVSSMPHPVAGTADSSSAPWVRGGPPLVPSYTLCLLETCGSGPFLGFSFMFPKCFYFLLMLYALDSALPVVTKATLSYSYSFTEIFTHLKIVLYSI